MTAPRPRWALEIDMLTAVAGDLIAQRTLKYPEAVEKGHLTSEAAADGLRIMAAIAHDWRRYLDLVILRRPAMISPPAEAATREERIATLEAAAAKAAALAVRKDSDVYRREYADLVETLLWWERQDHGIAFITDVCLELRHRAASVAAVA